MIDQNRKADWTLALELPDGTAVPKAAVHIQMQRHQFGFGSSLNPRYFLPGNAEYDAQYAANIPALFNTASYENHHKWKFDTNPQHQTEAAAGLDWLKDRSIDVRGHTMIWSRSSSVPADIAALLALPNPTPTELQTLYDATFDRIADIAGATADKVFAWDTLNESRQNSEIEDKLLGFTPAGQPTITSRADLRARWFQAAVAADPGATMMINDFQIIAGGGLADTEPQDYKNQIDGILAQGGPIQGIGFQSHFDDNTANGGNKLPTGPVDVWAVLDEFDSSYGLPLHITEFDFDTTDQQLQADYTRDFLTAVFAHDTVESFVMWGFWERQINKPNAALYDAQWNIKPNGQAYRDLVLDQWWTDEILAADATGTVAFRGFKGSYRVRVIHEGLTYIFDDLVLGDAGLDTLLTLQNGVAADTVHQGANTDLLTPGTWDQGLPTLNQTGLVAGDAFADNRITGMIVTQTAGTVRLTHTKASRSGLDNGTQWYLRGGVLADENSSIQLRDAELLVEGGRLEVAGRTVRFARGDTLLSITTGDIVADRIQFGAANATAGSKVFRLGLGDGTVTLSNADPFRFVNDGDAGNDYIDVVTGSQVRLVTFADAAYFEALWDAGQLRLDDQVAGGAGLTFAQSGITVTALGNGMTELTFANLAASAGDYNGSGQVEQGDLDLVLLNWGSDTDVAGIPVGWVNDAPSGLIDQQELDGVLLNWGAASEPVGTAIPEPGALAVILLGAGGFTAARGGRPNGSRLWYFPCEGGFARL